MTIDPTAKVNQKLRWYQFSLRTLLIVVTLFAFLCSWFAVKMQQAEKQRKAVEAIVKAGGEVRCEPSVGCTPGFHFCRVYEPTPTWLRKILGNDFFDNVNIISFRGTDATDANLVCLKDLQHLHTLDLGYNKITDDGMAIIKDLQNLQAQKYQPLSRHILQAHLLILIYMAGL